MTLALFVILNHITDEVIHKYFFVMGMKEKLMDLNLYFFPDLCSSDCKNEGVVSELLKI
jgi:hypothetical protein